MSRISPALAVAIGLALLAGPALAEGKLNMLGKFVNADTEVDIATYSQLNDKGVEERVGLIGIRNGERRNSAAFDGKEWPTFVGLYHRAEHAQSDTWRYIGDYTETGTADVSHLKVSAGPGVRFIVESPAKGAFTSDLQRSDLAAFDAAVDKVAAYLSVTP